MNGKIYTAKIFPDIDGNIRSKRLAESSETVATSCRIDGWTLHGAHYNV